MNSTSTLVPQKMERERKKNRRAQGEKKLNVRYFMQFSLEDYCFLFLFPFCNMLVALSLFFSSSCYLSSFYRPVVCSSKLQTTIDSSVKKCGRDCVSVCSSSTFILFFFLVFRNVKCKKMKKKNVKYLVMWLHTLFFNQKIVCGKEKYFYRN